jgi:phosphate/sulfate permease
MNNQRAAPSAGAKQKSLLFFALTGLLIASFLWNVFTTAHEYPIRNEQVLTMALNAGMVIGLFGIRNSGPKPLWWIALVAGIGLFAIRLTGDAAWWTGHLTYSLLPR